MTIIAFIQVAFSMWGGGHHFNINHSSIGRTGILVDFRNLNQIILSADKLKVKIGVGASWRGGGPKYSVVVLFTYATLSIHHLWFENRIYSRDQSPQLLNALLEYQQLASDDSKASIAYPHSENTDIDFYFICEKENLKTVSRGLREGFRRTISFKSELVSYASREDTDIVAHCLDLIFGFRERTADGSTFKD
ncbi:MAG: hypothetical protein Q9219_004807 [cf. Caloplaca sp. 3 TL-2023]